MVKRLAIGCVLGLAFACGDAVPVGQQQPSGADPELSADQSGSCLSGDDYEPQVEWDGFVENGLVPVAADRVRIRAPSGSTPGFVLFGSSPELPPPTDPKAAYPCEDPKGFWLPGHRYTTVESDVTQHRMRFRIWLQEPFDAWCKLQSGADSACKQDIRNENNVCTNQNSEPIDCRVQLMCTFCRCDATGCRAMHSDNPLIASADGSYARFDVTLDGDRADGSVQGLVPDISASIGGPVERLRLFKSK